MNATADALAALLAAVAAEREARCRALLAPAEAAAATLLAEAAVSIRRDLRRALREDRARRRAQRDAARAELDAALRLRRQRLAQAAVDEGWARLPAALLRCWQEAPCRARWIAAALDAARARLPPAGWCIRHPPALAPAEAAALRGDAAALGVAEAYCAADPEIAAGIAIVAGDARLDASVAGLLADRATVAGRLLYLWEAV